MDVSYSCDDPVNTLDQINHTITTVAFGLLEVEDIGKIEHE